MHLTPRQDKVAKLRIYGMTHKEIAKSLAISPQTVKNHIHSIYEKLDIHNVKELAVKLNVLQNL